MNNLLNNSQEPQEYDAVLGGNIPLLANAAVLGGMEGVNSLINNANLQIKIAGFKQALNYGDQGLDLVIQFLKNEDYYIRNAAFSVLASRQEVKIKQALIDNLKVVKFEVVTVNNEGIIIKSKPKKARYFTEILDHSISLKMILIPSGTFIMGSPKTELRRQSNEGPQRQLKVSGFLMGKFVITQSQYAAIMGYNPAYFQDDKKPVEKVNWYNAVEFCQKLSEKTGRNYRLPNEIEWEYACRAGTSTPYYFGETITTELANYNGHYYYAAAPVGEYRQQTTPVGQFPPNAFGLYDMCGNVWEWCMDKYSNHPDDHDYILRGGSWSNLPSFCRSAYRYSRNANMNHPNYGFRVVCSDWWTQ